MAWLPVFGIFNVLTDVDACNYTHGLYSYRKRVCAENRLWKKNPLLYLGHKPVSVLRLAFQLDTLATELFPPQIPTWIESVCWTIHCSQSQHPWERERENSELYHTRIKISGSCLFLQSVPANLHANRLRMKNSNNTDYHSNNDEDDNFKIRAKKKKKKKKILMMMMRHMVQIHHEQHAERDREREWKYWWWWWWEIWFRYIINYVQREKERDSEQERESARERERERERESDGKRKALWQWKMWKVEGLGTPSAGTKRPQGERSIKQLQSTLSLEPTNYTHHQTMQLFQMKHWGHFRQRGWSLHELSWSPRQHPNWTKLKW